MRGLLVAVLVAAEARQARGEKYYTSKSCGYSICGGRNKTCPSTSVMAGACFADCSGACDGPVNCNVMYNNCLCTANQCVIRSHSSSDSTSDTTWITLGVVLGVVCFPVAAFVMFRQCRRRRAPNGPVYVAVATDHNPDDVSCPLPLTCVWRISACPCVTFGGVGAWRLALSTHPQSPL